ncbi:MAG: hypothetical protein ACI8WT_002033 [Clostridium sp.]|jgi:hypothetical protein
MLFALVLKQKQILIILLPFTYDTVNYIYALNSQPVYTIYHTINFKIMYINNFILYINLSSYSAIFFNNIKFNTHLNLI